MMTVDELLREAQRLAEEGDEESLREFVARLRDAASRFDFQPDEPDSRWREDYRMVADHAEAVMCRTPVPPAPLPPAPTVLGPWWDSALGHALYEKLSERLAELRYVARGESGVPLISLRAYSPGPGKRALPAPLLLLECASHCADLIDAMLQAVPRIRQAAASGRPPARRGNMAERAAAARDRLAEHIACVWGPGLQSLFPGMRETLVDLQLHGEVSEIIEGILAPLSEDERTETADQIEKLLQRIPRPSRRYEMILRAPWEDSADGGGAPAGHPARGRYGARVNASSIPDDPIAAAPRSSTGFGRISALERLSRSDSHLDYTKFGKKAKQEARERVVHIDPTGYEPSPPRARRPDDLEMPQPERVMPFEEKSPADATTRGARAPRPLRHKVERRDDDDEVA
jgi:hypothetical protein